MGVQSTCGVRSGRLSCFVRLSLNHMASVLHGFPNLDAIRTITRRPILLTFSNWTPPALTAGVHSAQLPQFGRHPNFPLASIPHSFPNLDAIRTITRRPILLPFSSWTPPTQSHGVRSAQLPRFGRLTLNHMASSLSVLSNLDASSVNIWRPFPSPLKFWTPLTLTTGVHSAQLLQSGRLVSQHLASNLRSYRHLDASRTHRWRPFCSAYPIWTPRQSTFGVQSTLSSPFGRHTTFGRHATLDAMLHQNSPANIPGIPQNKTGNCPAFHNSGKPGSCLHLFNVEGLFSQGNKPSTNLVWILSVLEPAVGIIICRFFSVSV